MKDREYWVKHLGLEAHPEGGYFKETFRSEGSIPASALPEPFAGERSFSTAIYFMLTSENFSAFHRIAADELWHFYTGAPITVHTLDEKGRHGEIKLGPDPSQGQQFQAYIPGGTWFASEVAEPETYGLVGCTVAPGFDFADFEMAERAELIKAYPQHEGLIQRLTRS